MRVPIIKFMWVGKGGGAMRSRFVPHLSTKSPILMRNTAVDEPWRVFPCRTFVTMFWGYSEKQLPNWWHLKCRCGCFSFHVKVHYMRNTPFNNKERFYFMHEKSGREACDKIEKFQKFVFFTAEVRYLFWVQQMQKWISAVETVIGKLFWRKVPLKATDKTLLEGNQQNFTIRLLKN